MKGNLFQKEMLSTKLDPKIEELVDYAIADCAKWDRDITEIEILSMIVEKVSALLLEAVEL